MRNKVILPPAEILESIANQRYYWTSPSKDSIHKITNTICKFIFTILPVFIHDCEMLNLNGLLSDQNR